MRGRSTRWLTGTVAALLCLPALALVPARAQTANECFGEDNERRIAACSDMIATPGLSPDELSAAYAMRALGYSLKGLYDSALPDYDKALQINPDFAVALNNRAWAIYKAGRPREGLPDVEKSLALAPGSPHSYDTREHIRQALGYPAAALADYELAMRFGGERMVKLYQCGLQAHGLFEGRIDGRYTRDMREAMEACVKNTACDPLPADEECRAATS